MTFKVLRFKTPWGRFLIRIYNVNLIGVEKNADFTRFWRSPALAHLKSWSWRWRATRMAVAHAVKMAPYLFFWRSVKTAIPLRIYLEDCQRPLKLTDVLQILLIDRYLHWCFWGSWWHRRGVLANSRGVSCHRIQEMGFPKNFRRSWSWNSFSGHSFISPWPRTPELPFDPGRNWCEVTDMAGFDRTWALKFWAWNHCASESLEILLKWWNWPVMEQTFFFSVEISTACYWIGTVRQWTEKHCAENEISACTLVLRYRVNHRWLLKFEDEDCWGKGQTNGWYMDLSCADWSIVKSSSY